MTFDEYIQNPMGEKNAVMSNRAMYGPYYQEKLNRIMVREHGQINYKTYKDKKGRYLIYLKIPSEKLHDFYYDVVIEFRPPKEQITGFSLSKYDIRFFSNDPAFNYTFVHAFRKHGLLIPDFIPKLSERALKEKADEKNPQDVVGYVKSFYFAYLIMKSRGLFSKVLYTEPYNAIAVNNDIMDAEKKINERQRIPKELASQKKEEKKKARDKVANFAKEHDFNFSGKVKYTTKTKVNKMKSMVNTTKKVKKK